LIFIKNAGPSWIFLAALQAFQLTALANTLNTGIALSSFVDATNYSGFQEKEIVVHSVMLS